MSLSPVASTRTSLGSVYSDPQPMLTSWGLLGTILGFLAQVCAITGCPEYWSGAFMVSRSIMIAVS